MKTNTTSHERAAGADNSKPRCRRQKTLRSLFAGLDLHKNFSVLGAMTHAGEFLGTTRFRTREDDLVRHVRELPAREIRITLESGPKARWAAKILRPHCREVVVCEPRENRLISTSTRKNDSFDVRQLCRIYRMGELKEVWLGDSDERDVFRYAVYDMLKLRDRARESKTAIKARLDCWGLPIPSGREVYGKDARNLWLERLSADARSAIEPLYDLFDATKAAEKAARKEVKRLGGAFREIAVFHGVPGVAFTGAHVFSAIVEDPRRFSTAKELFRFAALAVTSRSSDGKPLGYERLDRRGHRELKNLSYHAWRTATRSTTRDNAVKTFYHESKKRTGSVTHARLATQRKVLATLWTLWRKGAEYSDEAFLQSPDQRRASEQAEPATDA